MPERATLTFNLSSQEAETGENLSILDNKPSKIDELQI